MSYHDEMLFDCDPTQAKQLARVLQIAHTWTWALLRYNVGLMDFPITGAFASSIAVDTIWRKDPSYNVSTPSYDAEAIPAGTELLLGDL